MINKINNKMLPNVFFYSFDYNFKELAKNKIPTTKIINIIASTLRVLSCSGISKINYIKFSLSIYNSI